MKSNAFYLILALALGACHRDEGPTTATGQVVDRFTGQPIPNATVQVAGLASGQGLGGTNFGNSFPADAQGRFSLNFEAKQPVNYTLFASTPSGYASDYGDSPILKNGRKNENVLVKAVAPAWVKINCVDDPPLAQVGLETQGYSGSGDRQNVGPNNFSFIRPTLSNLSTQINWRIADKQGNITNGIQPYTAANFDTVTVTIHF